MGKRLLMAFGALLAGLVVESRVSGRSFSLDLLHPTAKVP